MSSPARAEDDPKYEYKDVAAAPPKPAPKIEYHANVTLGLTWLTGNSESLGFSATGLGSLKHINDEFTAAAGGAYVSTGSSSHGKGGPIDQSAVTAQRWMWKLRYDRYFLEKNTVFVSYQMSGDEPAGYWWRAEPQVGYARLLFKSNHQVLRGELGYDYTHEHQVGIPGMNDVDYHSGRLFFYYENKFTPYASFTEALELLEAFNIPSAFRLNSITSLASGLYKNISLKVNFLVQYNNDPPPRPPAAQVPGDDHFNKVNTQLDLVLAVTFL